MRVFLDFEASSLSDDSYPIEVGWVFEDGRSESFLIKPAAQWVDWDAGAEAMHHLSRTLLENEGIPHDVVAHHLLDTLGEHTVYASAPSWDGKWLSVLFRAAGIPRHAMRLKDTDEAYAEAAVAVLAASMPPEVAKARAAEVVARALDEAAQRRVDHRALADAERQRQIWLDVRHLAQEQCDSISSARGMG